MTKQEYDRQRYRRLREAIRARTHRYYHQNKDKISEREKAKRKTAPEEIRAKEREYYHANVAAILRSRDKYRERENAKGREYRKKHRLRYLCHARNRRKKLSGDAKILPETAQRVYEANVLRHGRLTCYLCGEAIAFGDDSLEHKVPLSKGGDSLFCNLDVAHRRCNFRKGQKTETEYREWLKCLT